MAILGLALPIGLIAVVVDVLGGWDRWLPSASIPTGGIDRIARRARRFWLVVTGLALAPAVVLPAFTMVAFAPVAYAARAQLAIRRLRRSDVRVLAGERHVVVVVPRGKPLWLRASPKLVAACGIARATIVRS